MKTCTKCKTEKELIYFCKNKLTPDGLSGWCKDCTKEYRILNKSKLAEYDKNYRKDYYNNNKDKIISNTNLYYKNNKDKCLKQKKKYYQNNKDKILNDVKQYSKNNIDKILEYRLIHKEKFAEYSKEYLRKYKRNRRKTDPVYRLRCNFSGMINKALKKSNSSKDGRSSIKYLPYSIAELKVHLEKQFNEHMSWENHGTYWQIDHIYPQSLLPYSSMDDDNFKKCWSLENLRPLESILNLKKGNKIIA